jgi:hypothetical protein
VLSTKYHDKFPVHFALENHLLRGEVLENENENVFNEAFESPLNKWVSTRKKQN